MRRKSEGNKMVRSDGMRRESNQQLWTYVSRELLVGSKYPRNNFCLQLFFFLFLNFQINSERNRSLIFVENSRLEINRIVVEATTIQ